MYYISTYPLGGKKLIEFAELLRRNNISGTVTDVLKRFEPFHALAPQHYRAFFNRL